MVSLFRRHGPRTLAVCLAIALLFSACQGQGSPAGEQPPAPEETTLAWRFAMVTKEKNNSYMQTMFDGFAMGCEEIGAEALLYGPDSYDVADQIALVEELVEAAVDVIVIAANHTDELEDVLNRAMDSGIGVMSIDSSVNPQSRVTHIQQADPERVGRVLIQAAHAMVEGRGSFAIISSTPYATNQNLWVEWMRTELEENPEKYQNFTLLGEFYGEDEYATTYALTEQLLAEYPELDVIITPSAASMPAVGDVLAAGGSAALFTGLGLPSEVAPYIENGSCPWMYLWNTIELGYLAAFAGQAYMEGTLTGTIGENFPAGDLGYKSVVAAADGGTDVVLGNPVKFDEDNIELWKAVY